jgi:cell division protein FtsQ
MGKLVVEISQRSPVVRVEDRNHYHYFLDGEGYVIPANMNYTPHILIANGHIPGKYRQLDRLTAQGTESEPEQSESDRMMEGLLKMSDYINNDPFWRSQIVQLYVNEKNEFELIPRVGSQIILFGDAERMAYKFFKLRTLYKEGFKYTGWNQYEIINLKYDNQVICTKR